MHTYGDACEMTEMTNPPLSGVGEIAKKLVAVRLLRYCSYNLSDLSNFLKSEFPPISF